MIEHYWLPLFIPLTSLVAGVAIFFLREESRTLRTFLNLSSAVLKLILVVWLLRGVYLGREYAFRYPLFADFEIVLHADELSLLFVTLSAVLWLVTTVYAIGYLEGTPNRSRFFGFFSLCVSATTSIALAGNLFTFLVSYELLTLTTYPLVIHRQTRAALDAGRVYLLYTLVGGALLLLAMVWLSAMVGAVDFQEGGILGAIGPARDGQLRVIFLLLIVGFGVKCSLVPLHGWLPVAMIAPAPVSALLHAVAVVKAGAFGIVRVVYDVYGVERCANMGVMGGLATVAVVTILYGSFRALFQDDFKRRLAYSTVSQLSYIVLGVALLGPLTTVGGIVHLVHQGVMKITMFFCAGNVAEELHIHRISKLDGVGRRLPWTMGAFTVAALGMIGVPPLAGFVTKWYIGSGALLVGQPWAIGVLLVSSVMNAAYFLPIVYRVWFKEPSFEAEERRGRLEIHPYLLLPPLVTAAIVLVAGLFAAVPFSPLQWARLIMMREYGL